MLRSDPLTYEPAVQNGYYNKLNRQLGLIQRAEEVNQLQDNDDNQMSQLRPFKTSRQSH